MQPPRRINIDGRLKKFYITRTDESTPTILLAPNAFVARTIGLRRFFRSYDKWFTEAEWKRHQGARP